jgi:hypothetical protein
VLQNSARDIIDCCEGKSVMFHNYYEYSYFQEHFSTIYQNKEKALFEVAEQKLDMPLAR